MEKFKKFLLHPATMFVIGGLVVAAVPMVRKLFSSAAEKIPGAKVAAS